VEAPPRKELRGVVERLTYQNAENGWRAPERPQGEARVTQGDDRLVTLVGTLADITPGEAIVAHGWWQNNPKHGWQFQVTDYCTSLPATAQGMRRYLGSGLVKGIGPVNAGHIVDAFGEATFAVIDATPARLTEAPGIGTVQAGRITATWVEQRHIREVMTALQGYGVSTSLAVRSYKKVGDDSARAVWGACGAQPLPRTAAPCEFVGTSPVG
jgi:exodeoxyribonuclease V alpha subunit